MAVPTRAPQSLLAVFAHPDDESLASGGLLARCAAEGVRTSLLCLTRGGLGPIDDPARQRMGDERARELDAAAKVLGLHAVTLLDYRNGFLPWANRADLQADIQSAITRSAADVVVTFDDDGLYWHPDHMVVHESTTAAIAALGAEAPALFYVSMPRGAMRTAWLEATSEAERRGDAVPVPKLVFGIEVDAFGLFSRPPTLAIDASAHAAAKLRAIRCHQSQVAGDVLGRLPDEAAERALGVELYRRAVVGAQGETFVERMGQPV